MKPFVIELVGLMLICLVMPLLIAALIGFIFIQIKARPLWRLLSLAVAFLVVGSLFTLNTQMQLNRLNDQYADDYGRVIPEYIQDLDQMAMEGRTNDVHQSCQKFLKLPFVLSTDEMFVTNFNQLVYDTDVLTDQTNAAIKPVTTAVPVSTNK